MKRPAFPVALLAVLLSLSLRAAEVGSPASGGTSASPYESPTESVPESELDRLAAAKCRELGVTLPGNCSDAVFVRRVFLDGIGTLPTTAEVKSFLDNQAPDKRAALVDSVLSRREFADFWALKWGDLLRVKSEFPINLWPNAVQAYHHWIRESLKGNLSYDRFASELLTASGSNFRDAPVNFYRAVQDVGPETIAKAVALTFLGMRAEKWPRERLQGFSKFFEGIKFKKTGEWKEEIVYVDLFDGKALADSASSAILPDGSAMTLPKGKDPRQVLAGWLTDPKNPYLARALANRVWYWLMGRGIVHEADDLRPDNPPACPELLAYLERELVQSGYDVKHLFRLILKSRTYQRSTVAPGAPSPECFAFYQVRRIEAEVLADAICQLTGTSEQYSSPIPEPFMFIPENARSIELPDGSISSSFLELFGRTPRDTGLESERSNRVTASQSLHLLNSTQILKKLETGERMYSIAAFGRPPGEVVRELYLAFLARNPTPEELRNCQDWIASSRSNEGGGFGWRGRRLGGFGKPGAGAAGGQFAKLGELGQGRFPGRPPIPEAYVDLAWSLVNNPEFLYRH